MVSGVESTDRTVCALPSLVMMSPALVKPLKVVPDVPVSPLIPAPAISRLVATACPTAALPV